MHSMDRASKWVSHSYRVFVDILRWPDDDNNNIADKFCLHQPLCAPLIINELERIRCPRSTYSIGADDRTCVSTYNFPYPYLLLSFDQKKTVILRQVLPFSRLHRFSIDSLTPQSTSSCHATSLIFIWFLINMFIIVFYCDFRKRSMINFVYRLFRSPPSFVCSLSRFHSAQPNKGSHSAHTHMEKNYMN